MKNRRCDTAEQFNNLIEKSLKEAILMHLTHKYMAGQTPSLTQ